jgi:hypothetical protein
MEVEVEVQPAPVPTFKSVWGPHNIDAPKTPRAQTSSD